MAILLLTTCSTRKNNAFNRAYHTVTAHYNVNFNAKEALKKAELSIETDGKENYTDILPVYLYPPKESISSALPSIDRAIEKSSKSIFKHSIFVKGKEYVKPIDDAYLVMGKAYFHKQDYVQAQRVFSYIMTTHKTGNCKEEAAIWFARSLVRQNYFGRAEGAIEEAQYKIFPKKSKKLNVLFHAAAAEYHLTAPNGEVQAAIDHLTDAIANKPKKAFKTRMNFIIGQLYEKLEQPEDAQKSFLKVIRSNPRYDMEFAARMHLANNYDGTPSSKTTILKELRKMLADSKNEDFRDQIYYAISEIARIDEDTTERIKNLKLSVSSYTDNDYQRTFSSLKLADLYFSQEQYVPAQAYYDTATLSLPKDYPNYKGIINKTKVLTQLVTNLQIVQREDSLQRIAKMPAAERTRWVNKQIADYVAEQNRKAKEEADKELALQNALGMANINVNTNDNSGQWYFYNKSLVASGRTEFLKRWGTRKLADNWRVSNKQEIVFDNMNQTADADTDDEDSTKLSSRSTDPKQAAYYTQDLPLTAGALDTSNNKIANALYNAALVYLDLLNDQDKGNETLEKLVQRFHKHELTLPAQYLLYLNYTKAKSPRAETPKNFILANFPNSDYAKLIKNPDYYKDLAEQSKVIENLYEETYNAYSAKQWQQTIKLANDALPRCTDKVLKSKFAYLRAIALGQTEGENKLKEEMFAIVSLYPNTEVAGLAQLFLTPTKTEQKKEDKATAQSTKKEEVDPKEPFVFNPQEQHFVVMIVNVHKIRGSVVDIKNDVSTFNREFYSLIKLNVSSIYVSQDEQIITIAKFQNQEAAMDYYNNLSSSKQFSAYHKTKAIVSYPISASNYTTYYTNADKRPLYEDFFNANYLKIK